MVDYDLVDKLVVCTTNVHNRINKIRTEAMKLATKGLKTNDIGILRVVFLLNGIPVSALNYYRLSHKYIDEYFLQCIVKDKNITQIDLNSVLNGLIKVDYPDFLEEIDDLKKISGKAIRGLDLLTEDYSDLVTSLVNDLNELESLLMR